MTYQPGSCGCDCHGRYNYPCSVPGGCGSVGCIDGALRRAPCPAGGCRDPERHTGGRLCDSCVGRLEKTLADMMGLYAELGDNLVPAVGRGEPVSGSRTPPTPLRIDLLALREEMVYTATLWEEIVRDVAGLSAQPRRRDAPALAGAVRVLTAHLSVLLALQPTSVERLRADGDTEEVDMDGPQAACELLTLGWRVRAALGQPKLTFRLPAPCPRCDVLALTRADGDDWVNCGNCGAGWDHKHYETLVQAMTRALREVS